MIILDTAPWIWWVSDPGRLSRRARRAIVAGEKSEDLLVSAVSVWEVALKQGLRKLALDREFRSWIALASVYPGIRLAPVEASDSLESALLPGKVHRDPADRFIIALSRRLGAPIVTSDRLIRDYEHVETIW